MPTEVNDTYSTPAEEEEESTAGGNDLTNDQPIAVPAIPPFIPTGNLDLNHLLADEYKKPQFKYPSSALQTAYDAQAGARKSLDVAQEQREELELVLSDKIGKLQNLLRESKEREVKDKQALRGSTYTVYELELQEKDNELINNIDQIKAFQKIYKVLPLDLEQQAIIGKMNEEDVQYHYKASEWIRGQLDVINTLGPHHVASLEQLGIPIPSTDDDTWHKSLHQFQLYKDDYWNSPYIMFGGDVVRSIIEANEYTATKQQQELKDWCIQQQNQYEEDGFESNSERYDKLVDAGFTFDAVVNDDLWSEYIIAVSTFKERFGHVHIPINDEVSNAPPSVQNFLFKVRRLVERDALSPKRLVHLKSAGLYLDLSGQIFNAHVKYATEGRVQRGEEEKLKRKFVVLTDAEVSTKPKKRPVSSLRGSFAVWEAKLEKMATFWKENGHIHVENDIKLRMFVYSIIRKLNMRSVALKGRKMDHIEKHSGLLTFLLQHENIQAANADAVVEKEKVRKGQGKRGGRRRPSWSDEEERGFEEDFEELAKGVLLE